MIKKIFLIIITFILLSPQLVYGEEELNNSYSKLVDQFNYELEYIYRPYTDFVNSSNENTDTDILINDFTSKINKWSQSFKTSEQVYYQLTSDSDQNIRIIANKALESVKKGSNACNLYKQALSSETESSYSSFLSQGDFEFKEAVRIHDEAVDLYNDLSGAKTTMQSRNYLIFFSIISIIFSIILFFKSRVNTTIQADIIKGQIFFNLFKSSLWMVVGLLVTTIGLAYAIENGGSYYIFYGPVVVGGWQMLKGLINYITNDKKILRELANIEKDNAIRSSYKSENISLKKINIYKKCRYCGSKQEKKAIICTECGENII